MVPAVKSTQRSHRPWCRCGIRSAGARSPHADAPDRWARTRSPVIRVDDSFPGCQDQKLVTSVAVIVVSAGLTYISPSRQTKMAQSVVSGQGAELLFAFAQRLFGTTPWPYPAPLLLLGPALSRQSRAEERPPALWAGTARSVAAIDAVHFARVVVGAVRRRKALSLARPSASFWSPRPCHPGGVRMMRIRVPENRSHPAEARAQVAHADGREA